MVYSHHTAMFQKIGAIANDQSGALVEKDSISDEVFVPASLSPSESPPQRVSYEDKSLGETPLVSVNHISQQ